MYLWWRFSPISSPTYLVELASVKGLVPEPAEGRLRQLGLEASSLCLTPTTPLSSSSVKGSYPIPLRSVGVSRSLLARLVSGFVFLATAQLPMTAALLPCGARAVLEPPSVLVAVSAPQLQVSRQFCWRLRAPKCYRSPILIPASPGLCPYADRLDGGDIAADFAIAAAPNRSASELCWGLPLPGILVVLSPCEALIPARLCSLRQPFLGQPSSK